MKKFYIIIIGCQMNEADGERIAGLLEMQGMKPEKIRAKADLVVIVTCGVRQHAEDRIFGLIPKIKKDNPKVKILFTGCLAYREDIKKKLFKWVDWFMPISEITNYELRITNDFKNLKFKIKNSDKSIKYYKNYLNILPRHSSKFTAYIPIGNGCDNFCAYCVVPYARGREIYRPAKEIIKEVKDLVKKGYSEIFLIAQNVNSYKVKSPLGFARGEKKSQTIEFSGLLRIIDGIPGNFWIRFMTSHPKDMSDELIKTIAVSKKVCEHIHLPAQAGDNAVLKRMNRKYKIEQYRKLIQKIRIKIPSASITTDIIVGFPGETKRQFLNTVKLFKEVKYDMAYIARYSPRPGTVAAKMDDNVSNNEKRRREEELTKILRKTALANNKKYLHKTVAVLISGKDRNGNYYGYTRTFKNTKIINLIQKKTDLIGKFVVVNITKTHDFGLEGEIKNPYEQGV